MRSWREEPDFELECNYHGNSCSLGRSWKKDYMQEAIKVFRCDSGLVDTQLGFGNYDLGSTPASP